MDLNSKRLALCTTIYPGVEPYLHAWYASVLRQEDQDYQLWIALDELNVYQAAQALGGEPAATWVQMEAGETPATIRQRVLSSMVDKYDYVVLVDSDDILHPQRVSLARAGLRKADLVACALRLVDQQGHDLGVTFDLPPETSVDTVLPRHNIFGLSNTAWRCGLLQQCLPIPAEVELVDWFLATRAWLLGAVLSFDASVLMDYRQHPTNMSQVRAPFQKEQVVRDTCRVQRHFSLVRSVPLNDAREDRLIQLERVAADVDQFADRVLSDPQRCLKYIDALNTLDPAPLWWSCVAHPSLQYLWT